MVRQAHHEREKRFFEAEHWQNSIFRLYLKIFIR
jgi:hypothetical protein